MERCLWDRPDLLNKKFVVVAIHLLSCIAKLLTFFLTLLTTACQAPLSTTVSWNLVKFMPIEPVIQSKCFIPLLLLPSMFPSIRVFSNELALHNRWPKYWSFSFSISPFKVYSGLISFRIDCSIALLSKGLSRVFSSTIV